MPIIKSPSGQDWEYYVGAKGEFRWRSNDAVISLSTCKELKITPPACQESVYEEELQKSLSEYRKAMENHVYTEEELFEMRAAHGPGTVVVNVITGKKIKL